MRKNRKQFSFLLVLVLFFSVFLQGMTVFGDNTGYEPENPGIKDEQTAEGDLGMVVSAQPLASKVGADVLRNGGNAVDAAVAIQFALNVAEPMMSGIGGGGFLMYYDAATEDISVINSRERAPGGATPDMFIDQTEKVTGEGTFLLGANELKPDGQKQFHIEEVMVNDLDEEDSREPAFYYNFEGNSGESWSQNHFHLNERGTTFTIDETGGQILFDAPAGNNKTSFGQATALMEQVENSELTMRFRTDDPGEDRRLRLWLRADEFKSTSSTYVKNGYGIEIDTNTNEVKLIQAKDSSNSTLGTFKFDTTSDWQSLRFRVDGNALKVRLWQGKEEPEAWDIDTIAGKVMPFSERVQSGKSVGVPGTLKGLETALSNWGTMPMDELIQPAIDMAEDGIEVNWVLANAIAGNAGKLARSAAGDVFLQDGKPLEEGDLLVQKDLAKTFKLIAEQGSDVFYNGEVSEALADVVQEFDGSITTEDLSKYDVTEDEPVWGDYLGYDIASMPPPSSGGLAMLQMLKMFEEMDLTQHGVKSVEKYHHMAEAMHLAYADRGAYMGDPEYVDVPREGLLHPDYIKQRVDLINPDYANPDVRAGNPWDYQDGTPSQIVEQLDDKVNGETTHFTVADKWGNLVSYTTTIEQLFGSGIMVPGYGMMLNNELTDFDAIPGGANEVQPNKRPLSSMTPTIVLKDNKPFMTVGSPGGTTIITSVLQTIVNTIGYEMNLKDAIEEPRIYSDSYPTIRWEHGVPDQVRRQMGEMDHAWEDSPKEIGNVNSLMFDEEKGVYVGAADSTREGMAIGVSTPSLNYMQELIEQFNRFGDIKDANITRILQTHVTAVGHYKDSGKQDKAIKHLQSFIPFMEQLHGQDLISDQAYTSLKTNAEYLLDEWRN